jgi:hypothetical protein
VKQSRRRFIGDNLSSAIFHNVNLSRAQIRGAFLMDAEISGDIRGLKVNGIEVEPLIQAERQRRHPELKKMGFETPEQMRRSWTVLENLWKKTTKRALPLPEDQLRASVDEEWSFVDTLRHLIFVTDAWARRTVLREHDHFYEGGLANSDSPWWVSASCFLDPKANPSLDEVLTVRADRQAIVRRLLRSLTQEDLDATCRANKGKAYPVEPKRHPVRQCLAIVMREEWEHHTFAVRDLDVLQAHPERASSKKPRTTAPNRPPANSNVAKKAAATAKARAKAKAAKTAKTAKT